MANKLDASIATAGTPCQLGTDPAKFLEKFEDWLEHHKLLAETIGVEDNNQLKVLLLWSGKDFRKFSKEAGVVSEGETKDNLEVAITKIRTQCGSHVNLSMAMFKLMHAKQGTRAFTEFAKHIEELATQCQFDTQPYDKDRAIKKVMIFGTSDDKLRQEALGKDYTLKQLKQAALGYEQSRRSAVTIKTERGETSESCRKIYSQEQVDEIVAKVTAGKYSVQQKNKSAGQKCPNCPPHYRPHNPSKCPAKGKTCVVCKEKSHFAGSQACSIKVKSVHFDDEEESYQYKDDPVGRIETVGRIATDRSKTDSNADTMVVNTAKW